MAAVASALLIAAPTLAATPQQNTQHQQTSAQKIVDNAATALGQMKSNHRLDQLLSRAKGVFIIPTFVKGAVVIGGAGGERVLLARHGARWSDPAFFSLGSGSIGPQVGGEAGPMVMLLITNKAVDQFTRNGNFSLNANAGLTIVNFSARGQANVGKGDVIVWSGVAGGFAGVNVSATGISADTAKDRSYYGKPTNTRQILSGQATNPGADKLRTELPA